MSLASLALLLALAQAPAPCDGERVALAPLDAVVLARAELHELEALLRRAVASTPGVCLEPREGTLERLQALGGPLPGCADAACQGAQVVALGADRLVLGVALGVGGVRNLALTLVDRGGREARTTVLLSGPDDRPGEAEARLRESFGRLWAARPEPPRVVPRGRLWPKVLLATGGVALAAGVGFGLASRGTEAGLSEGRSGCEGTGEDFRACFAERMREGRRQARAANALLGAGAVLGLGGTLFLFWELP